jgi:hypothetical protein
MPVPESPSTQRRNHGWTDLVVKVCFVLLVGSMVGWYLPRYLYREPNDRQKWLVRPKLQTEENHSLQTDEHQSEPCFFLLPSGTSDGPAESGEITDCVTLVPNGKKLDLLELNLASQLLFMSRLIYLCQI